VYVHLMVGCESENGEVRMKTQCAECGRPFWAVKNWQRFCCTKHKDDFNNRKKKRTKAPAAERSASIGLRAVAARAPERRDRICRRSSPSSQEIRGSMTNFDHKARIEEAKRIGALRL